MTETQVEVTVKCASGRNCRATWMRHSLTDTRSASMMPLDSRARLNAVALAPALTDNTYRLSLTIKEMLLRDKYQSGFCFPKRQVTANVSTSGYEIGELPANDSLPQSVVDVCCQTMCMRNTQTKVGTHRQSLLLPPTMAVASLCQCGHAARGRRRRSPAQMAKREPDFVCMTYNNPY